MATEKAQRIIFDEADFEPRESATAAPVIGSEHQSGPAANAPADDGGRSLIVLDQERRLLAVRDINSKLGSLEGNVSRLSAARHPAPQCAHDRRHSGSCQQCRQKQ